MRSLKTACLGLAFALASAAAQAQFIPTDAEHAVILDFESGDVLFSKGGDTPMIPASMTKIMTVQVVFDRLERGEIALTDRFTVSENAWRKGGWSTGGSTMGLAIGEQPTVEELLRGVIVLSGNDACIVLAEGLSGTEEAFAIEMTELAQRMGLSTASFKNASGLDADGHRISAEDLAKLAQVQIEQFPELYKFYTETEMTWGGIRQTNRNPLLGRMEGVDGLKTGHLSISGYGLVASAERGGERRVIVINGLPSVQARAQEAERLMRLAFTSFDTKSFEPNGSSLAELEVWMGEAREVGVALKDPIAVTAHKRAWDTMTTEIVYDGPLTAPIAADDVVAELVITIEGKEPIIAPLYATASVEKLGFIGRAVEGLSRMMTGGS